MKLQKKITKIFQSQFPDLIEKIEKEVYFYLEESLDQREIDLNETIDYDSADFEINLEKMVNIIANSFYLIGIPRNQIEIHYKKYYRYFRDNYRYLNLKTFKDWLYREMKDKINFLLFSEILAYFFDSQNNIIKKMIDLDLLNEDMKKKLEGIGNVYPNLIKYLSWQNKIEIKLKKLILEEEGLNKIAEFKNPENNILSFYYIYSFAEFFGFEKKINLSKAVPYLIQDVEKWSEFSKNISLFRPSTLYSGLFITSKSDIDINNDLCRKKLKNLVISTLKDNEHPIFKSTYLINDILKAMKILGLKLTPQFLENIVKKEEKSTSVEFLRKIPTDQLALITLLFKNLGVQYKLNEENRQSILTVLNERKIEGLYANKQNSKEINIGSLWGALTILIENKSINTMDFKSFLNHIFNKIDIISERIDIEDPEKLAPLHLIIKIFEMFDTHYNQDIISQLENYIFNSKKMKFPNIEEIVSEIKENVSSFTDSITKTDSETKKESDPVFVVDNEIQKTDGILELFEDEENNNKNDLNIPTKPEIKLDDVQDYRVDDLLNNSSDQIVSFLINTPNLSLDSLKSINLYYNPITRPPEFVEKSLKILYKLEIIEKMLRLKPYYDTNKLETICRKFLKRNGTGFGDLKNQDPDIVNTFYGLALYDQNDMMDRLDIYKIHDYLLAEIKLFAPFNIYNNTHLFMCLEILEKHGIQMMLYDSIKTQILSYEYSLHEEFNILLDTFYVVHALKILDPSLKLEKIKDEYIKKVKLEVENDGSIEGVITKSAIVLITMGLLDLFNDEYEICKKLIDFIMEQGNFFDSTLEVTNVEWGKEFGFEIEIGITYLGLLSLMIFDPVRSKVPNPFICPKCGSGFKDLPKYCNICGHKFR